MRLVIEFKNKEILFYKYKRKKLINITSYSSAAEAINHLEIINSKTGIYIVFNLASEEMELLEVPQLYFWEKPAYKSRIEEKHSQHSTGFLRLIWTSRPALRPSKTARKDTVIKFFLPTDKSIEAVFNIIESRSLNLLGIESSSYFLSKRLLKLVSRKLKIEDGMPLMVLTQISKSEFRLFFFNHGLLSFVRRIGFFNYLEYPNRLLRELNESKSFVYENFLNSKSEVLTKVLIVEDYILNSLEKTQRFRFISLNKLTGKSESDKLVGSWFITSLFNQKGSFFYSNSYSQKLGKVKQLAKAINLVSLFILFILIFYLVNAFLTNNSLNSVSIQDNQQVQNLKDSYLSDLSGKVLAEDLIKSLEFTDELTKSQRDTGLVSFPHPRLAYVLNANKDFKLKALKWQRKDTLDDRVLEVEVHLIQAGRGGLQELSSSLSEFIVELEANLKIDKLNVSSEVLTNKPSFNFNSSLQELDIPAVISFETYLPEVEL